MSIVVGDATDGSVSGLAGRFNTAIKALIGGVTYATGTAWTKSLNAFAQAIVDALNNDKVGVVQVDQKATARAAGNSAGMSQSTINTWTDIPGMSISYTGVDTNRRVWVRTALSFWNNSNIGNMQFQFRILVDGVQKDGPLSHLINGVGTHTPFSFTWDIGTGWAGAHTIKMQVQLISSGGQIFQQDGLDYIYITAEEIG